MTNTEQTATDWTPPHLPGRGRTAHMPGDAAMWVMVLGDFVFFGAYFIIFMIHRAMAPEVFLQSQQHLNLTIGVREHPCAAYQFVVHRAQRAGGPSRRPPTVRFG